MNSELKIKLNRKSKKVSLRKLCLFVCGLVRLVSISVLASKSFVFSFDILCSMHSFRNSNVSCVFDLVVGVFMNCI